jgi:hypothetical protein
MMRRCPHCGTEVDADAAFCPSCGRPLSATPLEEPAPPTWPTQPAKAPPPPASQPTTEAPAEAGIVTWPVTLSGWLIGVGVLTAAFAMLLPWLDVAIYTRAWGLASGVNIIFFVILVGVAVSIFLSSSVPHIAAERLVILAVALIGVGIGLDRLGLPNGAFGVPLFFLAMLATAVGVLLVELNADRPLRGPSR